MGSKEAIKELGEKEEASVLVISDSHGATLNMELILREHGKKSDALIFCGDGISDLASCIELALNDKSFSQYIPPVIAFVEGNNDYDRYPMQNPLWTEKNKKDFYQDVKIPIMQTLEVCSQKIFITHGHRFSLFSGTQEIEYTAQNWGTNIALFGHTHIAELQNKTGMFLLNPGSCSRPRGGQPQTFAKMQFKKTERSVSATIYEYIPTSSRPYTPQYSPHWF